MHTQRRNTSRQQGWCKKRGSKDWDRVCRVGENAILLDEQSADEVLTPDPSEDSASPEPSPGGLAYHRRRELAEQREHRLRRKTSMSKKISEKLEDCESFALTGRTQRSCVSPEWCAHTFNYISMTVMLSRCKTTTVEAEDE